MLCGHGLEDELAKSLLEKVYRLGFGVNSV